MTSGQIGMLASFMLFAPIADAGEPTAEEVLVKMRAAYANLETYQDAGRIVTEDLSIGSTLIVENHSFETRFERPDCFIFEFQKAPGVEGEKFVIWTAGHAFNSWWSATQAAERYAPNDGASAFAVSALPSQGTSLIIPPLLLASLELHGPLSNFDMPILLASETLDGRLHRVLTADVRLNHWSDTTRETKVWIDVETGLISKIVEDTPSGQGKGVVQRATTTFKARANGEIEDSVFQFSPP